MTSIESERQRTTDRPAQTGGPANPFRPPDSRQSSQWWEWAACRMENAEMFFPCIAVSRGERRKAEREAKLVCTRCPVQDECLEAALDADEPYGVWGGYSARERRRKFGRGKLR